MRFERKCWWSLYCHGHSLANKTVVQLRPKSTTGISFFYWNITGTFVGWYGPSSKTFSDSCLCESCVRLCLILVCFCYRNDIACAVTDTSLYTGNTVCLEGYGYGSYWLTYVSCSHYKCIVTQNAKRRLVYAIKARQPRGGCEADNGSCSAALLFTLLPRQAQQSQHYGRICLDCRISCISPRESCNIGLDPHGTLVTSVSIPVGVQQHLFLYLTWNSRGPHHPPNSCLIDTCTLFIRSSAKLEKSSV